MNVLQVNAKEKNAPELFAQSLRETGFAVVTHHPISIQLIKEAYDEWGRFFSSTHKHQYLFTKELQAGYFPFRSEQAKGYSQKDLKEFYHYYPKYELPPEVRTSTPPLRQQLTSFCSKLLDWVEENLPPELSKGLSEPLSTMIQDSDQTLFRAINYPPLSAETEEGAVRAAAHEDINLITLLPAATEPGLQVKDVKGNWHEVPCDLGSIVVNSGDMLTEATDGYFPSTTHRVVNPTGEGARKARLSMPLFLHPRSDVILSKRYTAKAYLHERLKELGLL